MRERDRPLVRSAREGDVPDMVRIIRQTLPREILSASIYGTPGIGHYLASHLRLPPDLAESRFFVADVAGRPAGCLEVRLHADALFVNHIGVLTEYRGQGIGSHLLAQAIAATRRPAVRLIKLDVADDNHKARRWYERLGFRPEATAQWWEIPPGAASPTAASPTAASLTVLGFPQAEVVQEQLGFSQFIVRGGGGEYPVGRIGECWFRITSPEALRDPDLLPILRRLDPQRRILAILQGDGLPADLRASSRLLHTSQRMAAELDSLVEALAGAGPARVG